jgi:hypothetical protein
MRYRLSTLFIALALIGPACLALCAPGPLWAMGIFFALVLALLVCVLVAIYRRGETQAFAVGFLLFGSAFLLVHFIPAGIKMSIGGGIDAVSELLFKQMHGKPTDFFATVAFHGIFKHLLALGAGLLGGMIAQWIQRSPRSRESPPLR